MPYFYEIDRVAAKSCKQCQRHDDEQHVLAIREIGLPKPRDDVLNIIREFHLPMKFSRGGSVLNEGHVNR